MKMGQKTGTNELFQASHLTILVSYTIFSLVLAVEALLLSWEKWALLLIALAVVFSWGIHIRQRISDRIRLWIYSVLMMCTYFFYGIHQTSAFDLAPVMTAVMLLYTMTGIKALVTMCQVTFLITMAYDIAMMIYTGVRFDVLTASRLLLHIGLIIMVGRISKMIIDKWLSVLSSTRREIEQLTDATDRLNDFLANVSHEIRTPINAVIGLSGVCAERESDDAVRRDMLAVNAAGKRVTEQVGDILDYSEIDRGMLARNDEDYTLSSLFNDLVNDIRPSKPEHIELVIDVDPSAPAVMNTDAVKLKKILRHLIINGLKYTREGGVYVRISTIKEDYGVNLQIEVADTGIGMTSDELERVTERFYQANSGRTRSSSGLGLGMAIVAGFTESLGGFMRVSSEYGKGTVVHVSIPQKVTDGGSCMSVADRNKLCLGAFLHFDKFQRPEVRDYYNNMVINMAKGLAVQMHRVDNAVNLEKLLQTVQLTHLFVGEEEYEENTQMLEELAKTVKVAVIANGSMTLPENSRVTVMEKPFYCFPVAAFLNENSELYGCEVGKVRFEGVRALVVDDEPMNLAVARSMFGRYGMVVSAADSGQQAIEMCRKNKYDIIFMDHMMPGMDGVEAMKRIRSDPLRARGELPIVALTANAVSTAKEMFLSEGFDGFVSKPVELAEFERVMKRVLPDTVITYGESFVRSAEAFRLPEPERAAERTEVQKLEPDKAQETECRQKSDIPPGDAYSVLAAAGVDTDAGLKYCMNDADFYRSLLLQFADEAGGKRAKMEKAFADKEIRDYEVLVHALKSTSKMIGCMSLSESARELEFAAKDGRTEYIIEHHEEVMREYVQLTEAVFSAYGLPEQPETADSTDTADSTAGDILEFAPDEAGNGNNDVIEFEPEARNDN